MRAVVIEAPGRIAVQSVPDPEPGLNDVIVRVGACGLCGSDLRILDGKSPAVIFPVVPGHEFAGEVVEVGADVRDVRVGDRVAADPSIPCMRCAPCRRGQRNLCRNFGVIGATTAGAFAEYVRVPGQNVFLLPDALDYSLAALAEPFACVVHGIERVAPSPGDALLILGAGAIGLMLLRVALRSGAATVAVAEPHADRRQAAVRFGATSVHASAAEACGERSDGFDCVIDATGVPAAIEDGFRAVTAGGTLLLFGVASADQVVSLSPYRIYRDEIRVLGSMSVAHAMPAAIALLASGAVELDGIVTHTFGLDGFEDVVSLLRSGTTLKAQAIPGQTGLASRPWP